MWHKVPCLRYALHLLCSLSPLPPFPPPLPSPKVHCTSNVKLEPVWVLIIVNFVPIHIQEIGPKVYRGWALFCNTTCIYCIKYQFQILCSRNTFLGKLLAQLIVCNTAASMLPIKHCQISPTISVYRLLLIIKYVLLRGLSYKMIFITCLHLMYL